jgi:hypothetical protein
VTHPSDYDAHREFEVATIAAVERGELAAAAAAVEASARETGDAPLIQAVDDAPVATIDDWNQVVADFLDAQHRFERDGRSCDAVRLDLVNSSDFPELRLRRHFYSNPEARPVDFNSRHHLKPWFRSLEESVVLVQGLEALVSFQRRTYPPGPNRTDAQAVHYRSTGIAGWVIVIRYMQAVERRLDGGLPAAVPVLVSVDSFLGPQEPGRTEYGPHPRRLMHSAQSSVISDDVAMIRAARLQTRAQRWADESEELVANLRRVHQGMTGSRGEDFDRSLQVGMGLTGLKPLRQMSSSDFADLERRVREIRAARAAAAGLSSPK